jgi:hypothetical protein
MAQSCTIIASYTEAEWEDRRSRPHTKKFVRPHLNRKKLGMVLYTCHPRDGRKPEIGRLQSPSTWAKSKTLSSK